MGAFGLADLLDREGIDSAGVGTTSVTTRAPTLDDVYLQLTGERLAA